jgi:hypothetical protein
MSSFSFFIGEPVDLPTILEWLAPFGPQPYGEPVGDREQWTMRLEGAANADAAMLEDGFEELEWMSRDLVRRARLLLVTLPAFRLSVFYPPPSSQVSTPAPQEGANAVDAHVTDLARAIAQHVDVVVSDNTDGPMRIFTRDGRWQWDQGSEKHQQEHAAGLRRPRDLPQPPEPPATAPAPPESPVVASEPVVQSSGRHALPDDPMQLTLPYTWSVFSATGLSDDQFAALAKEFDAKPLDETGRRWTELGTFSIYTGRPYRYELVLGNGSPQSVRASVVDAVTRTLDAAPASRLLVKDYTRRDDGAWLAPRSDDSGLRSWSHDRRVRRMYDVVIFFAEQHGLVALWDESTSTIHTVEPYQPVPDELLALPSD